MHPGPKFQWRDPDAIRAFVRERSFGTLIAGTPDGPRVAHVPVLFLDDNRLGFHLALGNALTAHLDGADALFVAQGPDAYISPDWYGSGDQVPTWNYIAAELRGTVRREDDDALLPLVDALSLEHERRLAPKPEWTRDKMKPGLVESMTRGIVAFSLRLSDWQGTRKLGQNKPEAARLSAAQGVELAGNAVMAQWIRDL